MPRLPLSRTARARGLFRGAIAGARSVAPDGGTGDPTALLRILAEELAAGRTDLRGLAERWVARYRSEPRDADPETATALEFLDRHHAPPESGMGVGSGPLGRVLPIALVVAGSPRTVVSATFHVAALTHPDPRPAWAAVAVNVALARLVQGKRDFVPDVIEALQGNEAPAPLLAAVRRVPFERRESLPRMEMAAADAIAGAELVLWLAHHEPLLERGLESLKGGGPSSAAVASAAGALLGARDGDEAVPGSRLPPATALAAWDDLAERLGRVGVPA